MYLIILDTFFNIFSSTLAVTTLNLCYYFLLYFTNSGNTWFGTIFYCSYLITIVIILICGVMTAIDRVRYNIKKDTEIAMAKRLKSIKDDEAMFIHATIYLLGVGGINIFILPLGIILNYFRQTQPNKN